MKPKKILVTRQIPGKPPVLIREESWNDDRSNFQLTEYGLDGEPTHTLKTDYDIDHRVVAQEEHFLQEQITRKIRLEYPQGSSRKIEREYYLDGSNSRTVFFFEEESGNLSRLEKYEDETSEEPFEIQVFTYTPEGKALRQEISGDETMVKEWNYNENHHLVHFESRSPGSGMGIDFIYDDTGRLIRQVSLNNNKPYEEISFNYSGPGVSRTEKSTGEGVSILREYDDSDRLILEEKNIFQGIQKIHESRSVYRYNQEGLIEEEILTDNYSIENNYQNCYEYQMEPEKAS